MRKLFFSIIVYLADHLVGFFALLAPSQGHVPPLAVIALVLIAGVSPGFDNVGAWFGIVAPAGTPTGVVTRLNSAIDRALNKPEVREKLVGMSMVPVGGSPSAFRTFLEQDSVRWTALIKAADIKGD